MGFNQAGKKKINDYYTPKKASLIGGGLIVNGVGRADSVKESNFKEIRADLNTLGFANHTKEDVKEAALILGEILGRVVEVKEPPTDNGAAAKLQTLRNESSTVQLIVNGVDVRLDNDQMKHQHMTQIIGTRNKGGGNRWNNTVDANWHLANTLPYMAQWAVGLAGMVQGEQRYHGQLVPVNEVHYEGYCLFAGGQKYVLFHCYPSNNSPMRGPNG